MFELPSEIGESKEKYKILFFVVVFLLLGVTYYEIVKHNQSKTEVVFETVEEPTEVYVDVSGAVNNPGVYKLASTERITDALELAGGISNKANAEWVVSQLNMSQKVTDAQKLYIPFEWDDPGSVDFSPLVLATMPSKPTSDPSGASEASDDTASDLIDLNTATVDELKELPGIGEVYAGKIIEGRPYTDLSNLVEQGIVSESTWQKIAKYVKV